MALLVVPQFFTTYATSNLNSESANRDLFINSQTRRVLRDHINDALKENNNRIVDQWHYIESDLRCCGDIDMDGYECKVYQNKNIDIIN